MIQSPTKPASTQTDGYWEKFEQAERGRAGREPDWLEGLRRGALARFVETGYPTTHDEDWRFTNVSALAKLPFQPAPRAAHEEIKAEALAGFTFGGMPGNRLVFVDGHFAVGLSRVDRSESGVRILNLAAALEEDPDGLESYFGGSKDSNPFVALNTAFFADGAFIHIAPKTAVKEPVQIVHVSSGGAAGTSAHPRHLIVAEQGSELTVVETYVGLGQAARISNAVTELVLKENAKVEHCKYQEEPLSAYHIAAIHAELGRNCDLVAHSFALGARLSRNNIRTLLGGEGIECVLNGLYLTKDDQLADHHMIVDHAKPHCNSHEYFNGILEGRSRGVFHGRILVRQEAQKTDAKQTNKNLLLSDDAGVNTKPQLEIYADDVKCTHGATIGQLDEESIFYLRARGIGLETARRMLMHAFAGEIIERIRHRGIRDELNQLVWERLEQNKQISVTR